MTLTINISPDEAASLQEAAARHQQTPEEYLRAVVEKLLRPAGRWGRSWSEIEGTASCPMLGEDAQAWVTRTRREGDEHRARLLGRETAPAAESGDS